MARPANLIQALLLLEEHREQVEEALSRCGGLHSFDDVVAALETNKAVAFDTGNGVVVCEILPYPTDTVLHIWIVAGGLDAIMASHGPIADWGRSIGCTRATISGRKGWERVLKGHNWAAVTVQYDLDLLPK